MMIKSIENNIALYTCKNSIKINTFYLDKLK